MNDFLPTVAIFAAMVVGISYAPVPLWFKALVVVSGLFMMLLSLSYLTTTTGEDGDADD